MVILMFCVIIALMVLCGLYSKYEPSIDTVILDNERFVIIWYWKCDNDEYHRKCIKLFKI